MMVMDVECGSFDDGSHVKDKDVGIVETSTIFAIQDEISRFGLH